MTDPIYMRGKLARILQTGGKFLITDWNIDKYFPAPVYVSPVDNLMLALAGCRAQETRKEIMDHFCIQFDCEYKWSDEYYGWIFRKKPQQNKII
jgi:hypothetical protein